MNAEAARRCQTADLALVGPRPPAITSPAPSSAFAPLPRKIIVAHPQVPKLLSPIRLGGFWQSTMRLPLQEHKPLASLPGRLHAACVGHAHYPNGALLHGPAASTEPAPCPQGTELHQSPCVRNGGSFSLRPSTGVSLLSLLLGCSCKKLLVLLSFV